MTPEPQGHEPIAAPAPGLIRRQVEADLRDKDGRWALCWRMAVLCALTGMVFMAYQIPLAAIGCYLIFFVLKPQPTESILLAIGVLVLVSVVVGLLLLAGAFTLEHPAWRLAIIALSSMLFMYLGVASQLGPVGSIIALVVAFAITLFSIVPLGEILTRGLLYAWLMAATPMGLLIVFNLVAGSRPTVKLRHQLAERLLCSARLLEEPGSAAAREQLLELLAEGNAEHDKAAMLLKVFHVRPTVETRYLAVAVNATYQLMLGALAWADTRQQPAPPALIAQVWQRAQQLQAGEVPVPPSETLAPLHNQAGETLAARTDTAQAGALPAVPASTAPGQIVGAQTGLSLHGVERALLRLAGAVQPRTDDVPPKTPFMAADARSNPDYMRYAIKTTAAALIAYLVYTALDWQDIHTAMITCYVAALATTAETIHKLTLRIIGCLIGATLGIVSVQWIIPHFSGVGELGVLLLLGCLPAAWVATGPERIAYAGVQIALAFLLTVLQGFGPNPEISVALDRIWGVLLGNFVLFVIFTQIWPARVSKTLERQLDDLLQGLRDLAALPPELERRRTTIAADLQFKLEQMHELLQLASFEPRSQRLDVASWQRLQLVVRQAPSLIAQLAESSPDEAQELLRRVSPWQPNLATGTHVQT